MRIDDRHGVRVQYLEGDGAPVSVNAETTDLIGNASYSEIDLLAIPVARLDPEFLRLRSGVAGEVLGKAANYRVRIAIVGGIEQQIADSDALRDFVGESNRGRQIWFVPDEDALDARLAEAK